MAFESIPLGWVTAGKAGLQKLFRRIKDNFDSLNGSVTTLEAGNIVNASFDVDSDFNDSPDNWALALYAGGQPGLSPSEVKGTDDGSYRCKAGHTSDSTNRPVTGANWATYWEEKGAGETAWATGRPYRTANAHGERCVYFVHPGGAGNGGGNAESDYFPVSEYRDVNVSLTHWADNAAVHDKAEALYYDRDKLYLSATALFDNSGGNPTTPSRTACNLTPPAGARFVKVKIYGGMDDVNPGAEVTSYFDDVRVLSINTMDLPDAVITQEKLNYTSGANIIISNDTEDTKNYISYGKVREIRVIRAGEVNAYFEIKASGASTAFGKIYVNDSPLGQERIAYSAYEPYSDDVQVQPGDLVQLYVKNSIGGAQVTYYRNFRIRNSDYVNEAVLL